MEPRRKLSFLAPLFVLAFAGALMAYSPYGRHDGFSYKLMLHTVDINASPDSVFRFLGNSANAHRWSVFVDHITPLNSDTVPDGTPGSRRRCFCKKNESGRRWDELITEVVPGQKRRLGLYNMVGFAASSDSLATEQIYVPLDSGKCRLTFTVFFTNPDPSWRESLEMYFAAYSIRGIFVRNMANIKRIIETGK